MIAETLDILARGNLFAAAAILVVTTLRLPIRRLFGARVAYALWGLVPATVLASFLPAKALEAGAAQAALAAPVQAASQASVFLVEVVEPAARRAALDLTVLAGGVWAVGALLALLYFTRRQRVFELSAAVGELGPAVVGFVRPRIHLPPSFEAAFTAQERAVIVAHEKVHLRRQDARINGLVAFAQCLCWFNPLIHLGAHLMRMDQETACDEAVMARHPGARRIYAAAMLKTQLAPSQLPLGCYWPARRQSALEQRIAMLKSKTPGRARAFCGGALVTLLAGGAGYAAWTAHPAIEETAVAAVEIVQAAPRQDPLAPLAASVAGVLPDGLILLERENGVENSRTLSIGEDYRDGWRLEAVSAASATLGKGEERRTVAFEDRAPQRAAAEAAPIAGVINLSNAGTGQSALAGQADRSRIQAAIAAGDMRQVMALGGSANDVAAILAQRGGPMTDWLAQGGDAEFVNANGRTGIRVQSQDDQGRMRMGVVIPPELEGVAPPSGAAELPGLATVPGVRLGDAPGGGVNVIRIAPPGGQ